jgi:hypothetical protein
MGAAWPHPFFYQLLDVKPLTFLLLSLVTELTPEPLLRQQWLSLQIRVKLSSMLLNFPEQRCRT